MALVPGFEAGGEWESEKRAGKQLGAAFLYYRCRCKPYAYGHHTTV